MIAGDAAEFAVNFSISDQSANVVVKLEIPNSDNPEGRVIKSGTDSHTFTLQVPESAAGGYRLLAQLISADGNRSTLDEQIVKGVFVSASVPSDSGNSPYQLAVSPNPFVNSFTYEYNIQERGTVNIELFSMNGLKVKTLKQNENQEAGNYSDTVNTTDLNPGIYILRISTSSGNEEMRLIKN